MLFCIIDNIALMRDRERAGREARLSVGTIDSQTVKAPAPVPSEAISLTRLSAVSTPNPVSK
jgi:hypothetical protein